MRKRIFWIKIEGIDMKDLTKIKIIISLGVLFTILSMITTEYNEPDVLNRNYSANDNNENNHLKSSGYWDLTGSPIVINGDAILAYLHKRKRWKQRHDICY